VREKVWEGETWFLLGVFEFLVCFVAVICGEVVVDCVANVVNWRTLFGTLNVGHLPESFFEDLLMASGPMRPLHLLYALSN
jgi:hypothetical protein